MVPRFKVNLKAVHDNTGLSPYAVAKQTGLAKNTVLKYVASSNLITERLESSLLTLFRFYGVDWRDPSIVDVVDVAE